MRLKKKKTFRFLRFPAEVITAASHVLNTKAGPDTMAGPGNRKTHSQNFSVEIDGAEWTYNSEEEFLADYRQSSGAAYFFETINFSHAITLTVFDRQSHVDTIHVDTIIAVSAPARSDIEAVFNVFEAYAESQPVIPSDDARITQPNVFIGHGHNPLWRDLKDHLQDKHDYNVVAYEIGARAGHQIRDILEEMLEDSDFAIQVMTGEDETIEDELLARQNVVYELGLFQGRLGFARGIVLLEHGTQEFSNIHGVQQIRFSKGNIKETFGDVLATLRREFPRSAD